MQPTAQPGGDLRQPAPSVESVAAAFPQLEILELIGQGGMGCVFKARQPKLNRLVALKLLPASLAGRDPAFAGRFEREGQLLARLHHPNIVAVHDSGHVPASQPSTLNSQPGFYYLIMEYVDGVNLRQAMRARRFTPVQALAIVPHICDALQYAHDEGVLHRDIKPENILLDAKGRVKLADFGIAKLLAESGTGVPPVIESTTAGTATPLSSLTQSGTALGTPSYMAPEQRDTPADVDHRADIYSLGVVFYELLTGELPQGPLARPSEKSSADPRVDAIVQQALEKERDRRQQSVGEVKTQVETLSGRAGVLPVEPGSASASIAAPPRFSRHAIVGAVWLGVALVGILTVAGPIQKGLPWWQTLLSLLILLPTLSAPLGTTILGWVAVSQIRRSAGKFRGLGLAVFDGLFFPLLALDGFIGVLWSVIAAVGEALMDSSSHGGTAPILVLTVLTSVLADYWIIRSVWRAARTSPQEPQPPLRPTVILQTLIFALVCALFVVGIPQSAALFREFQVALPPAARFLIGIGSGWGILIFPLLLGIVVAFCFLARDLAGKRGLRWWSGSVIVGMVLFVAMSCAALWLPMRKLMVEFNSAPAQSLAFGPVIERVLPFDRHFIDFQSGSVMRPDYEKFGVDGADWEPWIQQTGADAMVEESPQPGFEPPAPNDHGFPRLVALTSGLPERRGDRESCVFVGEETDDFDSVRPNDADARLKVVTERDLYWGHANGSRPWWFRTRDGAKGVLQILGTSDKPRGLKIRYKLLGIPAR